MWNISYIKSEDELAQVTWLNLKTYMVKEDIELLQKVIRAVESDDVLRLQEALDTPIFYFFGPYCTDSLYNIYEPMADLSDMRIRLYRKMLQPYLARIKRMLSPYGGLTFPSKAWNDLRHDFVIWADTFPIPSTETVRLWEENLYSRMKALSVEYDRSYDPLIEAMEKTNRDFSAFRAPSYNGVDECLLAEYQTFLKLSVRPFDYGSYWEAFDYGSTVETWARLLGGAVISEARIKVKSPFTEQSIPFDEIRNSQHRFVIVPFQYALHQNVMIFDRVDMVAFNFEPYGEKSTAKDKRIYLEEEMKPFKYISPRLFNVCPVQHIEELNRIYPSGEQYERSDRDPFGFCIYWSWMFAYLFLKCTKGSLVERVSSLHNFFNWIKEQSLATNRNLLKKMVRGFTYATSVTNSCPQRSKLLCEFDQNCEWIENWTGRVDRGHCQQRE